MHPFVDRRDRLAFARDLRRDALRDLGRRAAVDQDVVLRLSEQVDEPGRDDEARGVDRALSRRAAEPADRRDLPAAHPDVRREPGSPGPVDDAGVDEQDVVGSRTFRGRRGGAETERETGQDELFHDVSL